MVTRYICETHYLWTLRVISRSKLYTRILNSEETRYKNKHEMIRRKGMMKRSPGIYAKHYPWTARDLRVVSRSKLYTYILNLKKHDIRISMKWNGHPVYTRNALSLDSTSCFTLKIVHLYIEFWNLKRHDIKISVKWNSHPVYTWNALSLDCTRSTSRCFTLKIVHLYTEFWNLKRHDITMKW